ncbi:MAG: transcription-repair coupling factor [Phycisphaerales bacterium]
MRAALREAPLDLIPHIRQSPHVARLAEALIAGRHAVATGAAGSSTALVAGAIASHAGRALVLLLAHLDDADEAADELASAGVPATRLPGLEVLPGETHISVELFAERLGAVRRVLGLAANPGPHVVVAPIQALMQAVPATDRLDALSIAIQRGQRLDPVSLTRWLGDAGYKRLEAAEEPGDFALRGGILDVFPAGGTFSGAGVLPAGSRDGCPTVFPISTPIRIDFFGDDVERITEIDPDTMGSGRALERVEIVCAAEEAGRPRDTDASFLALLPKGTLAIVSETMEVTEQGRGYYERVTDQTGIFGPPAVLRLLKERCPGLAEINQFSAGAAAADVRIELPVSPIPSFSQDAAEAIRELGTLSDEQRIVVFCQNPAELQRFQELVAEFAPDAARTLESQLGYLHRGFTWSSDAATRSSDAATQKRSDAVKTGSSGTASLRHSVTASLIPYSELLHRYHTRRRAVRLRAGRAMDTFLDFAPGDYVVHAEHGIARFIGLKAMKPPRHREVAGGADPSQLPRGLRDAAQDKSKIEPQEYLTLEFSGGTKLHVPTLSIDQVQKYIGGFKGKPQLSTLGGQRWKAQKERVTESVRDLAAEMLRVRAARESMPGIRFPGDTAWQKEFEAEFPYDETDDQLAALAEIKKDMQSDRPMDRLVCGDVGFGKTELAIRAAFKAVEFGKQVAVLVPTTVLAEQHERTFRARFADYPFKIESLSRFKTGAEANQVLAALRKGHVDVVIGTHRLLSADVKFADLGLVVVDEEQRFGVEHKERLLRLRLTVDVLTLSATPIPRTLHMAMLGLRDISSLATPPLDRRAIVTEVIPYNARRIAQALARELAREGQVYFVHNRIHDITSVADEIQKLAPEARIVVGHGQMNPHELEQVMLRFMRREADILVSTTIIESGIDNPTANTMFIDDADRYGLADLHQLRGRVGRYKHRAYCYMLLPADRPVREVAQKRLKAIEQYSMLGAGFKIAMRDLEIRGAGNLLGAEQSGHIAAVGYEMYCRLLDTAVRELKHEERPATASSTGLDIGLTGTIPRAYIASDQRRMEAYRRIATATSAAGLAKVAADFTEAYGEPPALVKRLLEIAEARVAAAALGVRTISIRGADVLFRTDKPEAIAARLSAGERTANTVRVLPPPSGEKLHEVYWRVPPNYLDPETLVRVLRKRLSLPQTTRNESAEQVPA